MADIINILYTRPLIKASASMKL